MLQLIDPYVARERHAGPYKFDIWIEDEEARDWYGSPDQLQVERKWWVDTVKPGFTIIECGAHQGLTTILLALCAGPTGIVHAWEASSGNAALIEKNIALNGLQNVVVHACGVGAEAAVVPVAENRGNFMVLNSESDPRANNHIRIEALDEAYNGKRKVDFMKIDVEGQDLNVLRGASKLLQSDRPYLNLELHNFLFQDKRGTVDTILALLSQIKYSFVAFDPSSREWRKLEKPLDTAWLADRINPQLFCTPSQEFAFQQAASPSPLTSPSPPSSSSSRPSSA